MTSAMPSSTATMPPKTVATAKYLRVPLRERGERGHRLRAAGAHPIHPRREHRPVHAEEQHQNDDEQQQGEHVQRAAQHRTDEADDLAGVDGGEHALDLVGTDAEACDPRLQACDGRLHLRRVLRQDGRESRCAPDQRDDQAAQTARRPSTSTSVASQLGAPFARIQVRIG